MDVYLDQLRRVVKAHDLTWLRYLPDGWRLQQTELC